MAAIACSRSSVAAAWRACIASSTRAAAASSRSSSCCATAKSKHDQLASELFEREFRTLVQLSHPRVIEVYDYGIGDAGPYYTMELLDGSDLRELSPLPWRRACELVFDVCSSLALLHSRRLVHRDISPRNVRCTRDGLAKLIDFGAMVQMGPCAQVVGTPAFVAPEVVQRSALDGRTDLYSLGATLVLRAHRAHAVSRARSGGRAQGVELAPAGAVAARRRTSPPSSTRWSCR